MKINEKFSDSIMIFEAIAWIGTCIACMIGWAWGWIFVVGLMVLGHILNGVHDNGVIDKKLLIYPIIPWFITYMIGMAGSVYYHLKFLDEIPSFYILGQHPSHFYMLIFYWICGILTICVGFIKNKEAWCSTERWENFKESIEKEKAKG